MAKIFRNLETVDSDFWKGIYKMPFNYCTLYAKYSIYKNKMNCMDIIGFLGYLSYLKKILTVEESI